MPQPSLLIIGGGSIGERHLRCFLGTGRVRVSLCDIDESIREKIADQYDIEKAYASLDAALEDPHDAAVICSPAHLHIPMAIQLAQADVSLLIEKPLSLSTDGLDELKKLIEEKNLVTGVAYVHRAHPALSGMRDAIRQGRFGKPVYLIAICGQHFPTYRPAYREIYYRDHRTGGGAIHDALSHIVNAAEWLVGPTDRVTADAAHLQLDGVEVEDTVHVLARHGDLLADYSLNQFQAPNELSIQVVCEKGTVRYEPTENRWRWMTEPSDHWHDEPIEPLQRDGLFLNQAENFLDALEGKQEPACSLMEGINTMQTILSVHRAIVREDRFIEVQ